MRDYKNIEGEASFVSEEDTIVSPRTALISANEREMAG